MPRFFQVLNKEVAMKILSYLALSLFLFTPTLALADAGAIASAESAGPGSISKDATIKDWNMR